MRFPSCAIGLAFLLVLISRPQAQAPANTAAELGRIGPQVGDVVPDFELPDQDGHPRSLSTLQGPQGLMLVFFRSADW